MRFWQAERSQVAAKEISGMITDTVNRIETGVTVANECGESLDKIVTGITEVSNTIDILSRSSNDLSNQIRNTARLVQEIAAACGEQASGSNQIRQAVTTLDQVTQQNSATSEETAAASEELSSQAQMMQEMVAQFKINTNGLAISHLDRSVSNNMLEMAHKESEVPHLPAYSKVSSKSKAPIEDQFGVFRNTLDSKININSVWGGEKTKFFPLFHV